MSPTPPAAARNPSPGGRPHIAPWLAIAGILVVTTIALKLEGRVWFCEGCEHPWWPWISDVWTKHCSQHLADPYSLTHLSHGLIFYIALAMLCPRVPMAWRLCTAVGIAAAWEVLENSSFVINRYRESTMSLDYLGDSILNSLGDILSCFLGFLVARRIGILWTLAIFAVIELALLALIRDNLTLNVIMLIHPVQAIKAWQSVGH